MERWKLNSHCVYNLELSNVCQFNDFINVQWLAYLTKTCYDLILHETQKDFLNGNTQSSFLWFLSYKWAEKNISRQYKILCQEERTTQQAISEKLNLQLKSLKFFFFFPHDCALNTREEGEREERKKNGKGKYHVDISEVLSLLWQ